MEDKIHQSFTLNLESIALVYLDRVEAVLDRA